MVAKVPGTLTYVPYREIFLAETTADCIQLRRKRFYVERGIFLMLLELMVYQMDPRGILSFGLGTAWISTNIRSKVIHDMCSKQGLQHCFMLSLIFILTAIHVPG